MFPVDDIQRKSLREEAYRLKLLHKGPYVYFRGLIEISNICRKNCLYCGIRRDNCSSQRYELSDIQVLQEAQFALDAGYGSLVIQGGERCNSSFVERITRLVYQIRRLVPGGGGVPVVQADPANDLGITLSLGEQSLQVYKEWKKAGASRYLLRIEASDQSLYNKIHPGFPDSCCAGTQADMLSGRESAEMVCSPDAELHSYQRRVQALMDLKSAGYRLGTGVMIGLPFQTYSNLENDLRFFKEIQVNMVGMGPYIPHKDTPLGQFVENNREGFTLLSKPELLELCLDMVSRLRIMMPHINIAATTALQVLDNDGREKALLAGANVIMPNMTETSFRGNYSLYEGKQGVEDDAISTKTKLLENLSRMGIPVGWNRRGD